jgi:CRP-like cAMP-binding protein
MNAAMPRRRRPPAINTSEVLRNVPLFQQLGDEQLSRIAAATAQVRVPAEFVLFRRGDMPTGLHVVAYGQVKLAFLTADGVEKVVDVIGPGASFGEAMMLLEKPYLVTAQTLTDSLLLTVGKEALLHELDRNPAMARRMLAGLSMRLHAMVADLESLSLRTATQRVVGYLLRDVAEAPEGPADVRLTTPKSVIASKLNISREHFSRILHELIASGLIEVSGRSIRILDVARLRSDASR